MSAIRILATQPWVERLGLTLLHFVWQGAVIAALYAAARGWSVRRQYPRYRYLLGCVALSAMAIVPIMTWMLLPSLAHGSASAAFLTPLPATPLSAPLAESAPSVPPFAQGNAGAALPGQLMTWVVGFWLIGTTAFLLRLIGGWIFAVSLRYRKVRAASVEWQRTFDRLKARISVTRRVPLLVSGVLDAPAVIGWLRPIVLVPAGALAGLPTEQMEALLLHELAHIRRHDYLVQILQSVIEAVLFYHPGVWWISGHMRTERELCCDDIAVSITGDAVIYARALADLDSERFIQPAIVGASGGSVANRIARLLGQSIPFDRPSSSVAVVPALALLAIAAWAAFGQPAARPVIEADSIKPSQKSTFAILAQSQPASPAMRASRQSGPPRTVAQAKVTVIPFEAPTDAPAFESVSIWPCQPEERSFSSYSNGRSRMSCQTVKDLVRFAYVTRSADSQQRLQIDAADGLSWVDSERFMIDAKADVSPNGRTIPEPMLRTLLEDRFHLKFHYENREAPVYALSVASDGLKMRPFQEGSCTPLDLMKPDEAPRVNYCRNRAAVNGPVVAVDMQGISIDDFRLIYLQRLNRPVVDKTGLTGRFDFHLVYAQTFSSSDATPTITTAMREQLGLQLDPDSAPLKFLIIDSAERPAGN